MFAETHAYLFQNALLLRAVHLFHRIHDGHLHAVLAGCVLQRLDVLGEARPAVAHSGIEEVIADTLVGADSMAHRLYVCAEFFGKICQFVHEGNAGGQHRIRGILGQFR